MVINSENYHALEALTYAYAGKVDCIYIDPPYNGQQKDWKYNNDYVSSDDQYKHSKWLTFMERRLKLAKQLLNPKDSVLIVTIDEKEYSRLALLLEQMFPEANIQMITSIISQNGTCRENEFSRVEEYIFVCRIGNMVVKRTNDNMLSEDGKGVISRVWFNFMRTSTLRTKSKGQFFPIFIDVKGEKIVSIGDALEKDEDIDSVVVPDGQIAVFPIRDDGQYATWGAIPETTRKLLKNGFLRIGSFDKKTNRWSIQYVRQGDQKRIASGEIIVTGKAKDGSLLLQHVDATQRITFPKTVWNRKTHDATEYGTRLLKQLFGDTRFSFPKSLYAVKDVLNFFLSDNPNALVVDFFAGSGTTLHAVNLLNAEDGGHRRCICVTNNEVSADEEKKFIKQGLRPSDPDWERYGIANYVTWERTKCSINGVDVKGNPLKGKYIGSDIPMSDGFKANAIFCELTYESAWPIRLDNAFDAIAPILWMQAGCKGPIIRRIGKSYLTTDYYGVLFNYNQASKFCEKVKNTPSIKTVFIVTDDQRRYSNMCKRLPGIEVHRLYETYLRTFEICGEGGLD